MKVQYVCSKIIKLNLNLLDITHNIICQDHIHIIPINFALTRLQSVTEYEWFYALYLNAECIVIKPYMSL